MTNHTFRPGVSFLLRDVANGAAAGMLLTKYWEADTAATRVRDAHFILIGTLRDYRKRGVASALIGHALRAAADQDYDRASLRGLSRRVPGASGFMRRPGSPRSSGTCAGRLRADVSEPLEWIGAWLGHAAPIQFLRAATTVAGDVRINCGA